MSDWTPPADAKKVTPAASGWKPPSDAKKADGAPFPSAPPASGEEGLGGPAVSRVPSTNGYAPQPRHLETGGLRPFKGLDAAAPRRPQMTPTALSPNRGTREDGTNKGPGWLGSIPAADGKEMTELSFDFDVDGKNIFAPLLVPTLSEGEVALLASGGEPTDAIYKKAQDFAIQRLDQGKSPFKEDPRSIVKKEKAEEIDLIGADRTTQQPSTIQAPQFDITPATAKQKKKAEEDARIEDRYQSEFSSATEEEVQKAKSVNQSMRSSIPAMEGAFLEGVERLKQQGQLLTDQRQILDSMDPSDPAYQGALDQYNERVKAFRKEQSGIELEALVVDDLVKKSAIDEFLLNRREHAIKAGHGNIPAAMGYASLDMLGKSMAGTLDVIGKVIPTDQEILEFAGALPEGSGTESRKEWRNYLKDVEKAPTRLTGIDQFVTPEYVDKKKDESLFAGGLIAVAEMAPAIAAGMATGGAGMGASFFTSSYRDLDQEMQGEYWDQIPEAEKEAIKVGTSFVSAGLSTMGMKALAGKLPVVNDIFFRAARKFAPGMSPGQLRRIIDAETKSYVANVASKIGQGFAIEGTEELADYGQEELVKHLYENYKRDELGEKADTLFQNAESIDQLGEGAWKSFVIGGIAGNMIGGSVAALSSVGARKRLSEKEFGVFKDLLESGSLLKDIEPIMAAQVAAGEMSQSDFDKTMEDVSKAESAISQIPEGLDIKATREAFDLLLEKDKLKTKDKILSAPKMQKIDEKLQALVGVPKEEEAKTEPTKKKAGTPDTPSKTVEWEGKDVQPKEQVTTPNENERTEQPKTTGSATDNRSGESGASKDVASDGGVATAGSGLSSNSGVEAPSPAISGLETAPGMEAVAAGEASGIVPDTSGETSGVSQALPSAPGGRVREEAIPPTGEVQGEEGVQSEAPKPVAKKEAPSPGQGEGTTKSPYHSTSGKKYGGFSVTYDPEIGKMKTTMLGTPPPSGAEKFPVGSKERAKKSSNRIKAIRKARQEAEDELARKLGIAKDGRFERGSNALEKREEEKERRAAISKKADRLDEDALGVYGVVLRAMADGDMKITPESIAKYLGWGGGRNDGAMAERRKTEEETKASWTLDDGGEHINNAAHGMMEGSTMKDADGDPMDGWSEADFAEAIAQVASGYTSSQEAYVQLERMADDLTEATLSPEDAITAHENAILNGLMEDADVEGNLDAAQASILNMSEAQLEAQYQDYLNTQRDENQEDTDGNDNQGAADSALGEQDDSGEEGASTATEEDGQALSDRINKLADDLEKGLEGMVGSFPIPPQLLVTALRAVATAVKAGETLAKAITKGLKELRESDWYKGLNSSEQSQAEAEFKAPIKALATPVDKKPSTAPKKLQKQVMEAVGKKPAPKIVVNEKAALKDQIRMAARIAKEAVMSGAIAGEIAGKREGRKEGAKETSDRIKESRKAFEKDVALALGGKGLDLSLVQSRAIAKEAARVDPTNDMQVSRFIDHAMKVMGNAEWADQVEQANIMRGRAAKASKRKSVPYNHKEVLKRASEVDPAILDNPGEYADIVQRYLGNVASPLSSQYAGTEQITEGEFQKYLSEWEAQMDQKYEDLLMDELGITVKKGQAKEIYKSIQEGTIDEALRQMDDPKLKAEIESRVREMSQQRIAALKQHDTSGLDKEEVRIVKDIASADIDRLTVAQQADIIRASDNIILNNGFGGATLAASIASASNAVKPALDIAAKSGIRRALGIAQEFFSQSDAWTFFFGQAKDVGKIQNLVGFGDYVRGKAEFMKEQKKVRQDMEQFFSRLRAKYKDADSFESMTAEWIAGWVIQAMPKLNPKQSFEANKAMLQEDINRKMPTKSKKEAEMAQTVFDKIIAPANTREEALALLAKNYPSAKQSIDFMVNLFKPYRDRIQANSVRTWNMSGDYSDPYYLPKAFFTRGAKSLDVEPYSNKKNLTTMRPGQAGGTKARMTYRSLAENRLISPNIRNNVFSSLSDDLYGVATDAARMRLNEFMKMPDSNGVFGNEENKGFMAAMMHNYITAQDKSSGDQSEVSRWVNNRINDARTLASVQALAGFTQITRQLPEAVTQGSIMMGRDFPLLFKNIPEVTVPSSPEGQGAANLMGNYAIGSREHAKAGMAWEGKVNSLNNAFQKAMQSGRFREAMKIRAKIQKVFMWSLMKGDLLSARAAWLGFYEKARKMDGHEVESWQTEASMHEGDASRQDAALYADTMVNRMTVSSDPAQAARIAQRTKSPTANAFKALVQAFVGTAIQQVGRRYAEVSTLGGYAYKKATGQKTGEAYDPKRALMSLVAGTTGNAVFLGSRLLIASALRDAIGELYKWAVDDDDDDEEPSTKAKAIFGFMTALYMGGMMDSDIFRAIDKAERERGRKPKDPESESVKKYKLFKSQMLSEFIGSSIWQIADDAFIDGLNRMAYSAALDAGEPSAFTKGGDPKPFRTWLQDPKNAPFYRYGQTKFVDRDRWIPDLDDAGILGVFTKNAGYMLRNINNIFGDEETEYKNEYQKAVKDIREASKERTEKASDIVARYEAGELTKEQSNKEFEKTFKDLPKDEYNKAARAFLDKRRYADAPDNVKEVLDINSVPVRVKMVRDMRSTMNAAEKKAFDSELRKANVMTDSFLKEYKSVKK
jgi:hypothetical protein